MGFFKIINIDTVLVTLVFINSAVSANDYKSVYEQNCSICHGVDGHGIMPGIPDLKENTTWSLKSDNQLLNLVKNGFQSPDSIMAMPPKGGNANLSDQQIISSILYMRSLLE